MSALAAVPWEAGLGAVSARGSPHGPSAGDSIQNCLRRIIPVSSLETTLRAMSPFTSVPEVELEGLVAKGIWVL